MIEEIKAIEKITETATNFVNSIIQPSISEVGLLIRDQVAFFRFRNQIKILEKARILCESKGINPKIISLKTLVPYLDYSGLEDDEEMQDAWAKLLSNLVDSEKNIENNILPHILNQISKDEFSALVKSIELNINYLNSMNDCFNLAKGLSSRKINLKNIGFELKKENIEKELMTDNPQKPPHVKYIQQRLLNSKYEAGIFLSGGQEVEKVAYDMDIIKKRFIVYENLFKDIELSNITRLGLCKIENDSGRDLEDTYHERVFTPLGITFMQACTEYDSVLEPYKEEYFWLK